MSLIDRRKFILGAASALSLPLLTASESEAANSPRFRFAVLDNETLFALGETIPLQVFTKTPYPRLRVNFRANGQIIGTATSYPYKLNWIPPQTGDYGLTAEVITPQTSVTLIGSSLKVLNLLYDGIGRRGARLYEVSSTYSSYQSTSIPEANRYGFPMNYLGSINTARTVQRIELLFAATSFITNTEANIPLPNFLYVAARLWNDGAEGFMNNPLSGNLANLGSSTFTFGSATTPYAVNTQGINFYLAGWSNLNFLLPANVPLAMSIQFAINSPYDFTERIKIAQSRLSSQNLLYANGQFSPPSSSFSNIGSTAVRIWTS